MAVLPGGEGVDKNRHRLSLEHKGKTGSEYPAKLYFSGIHPEPVGATFQIEDRLWSGALSTIEYICIDDPIESENATELVVKSPNAFSVTGLRRFVTVLATAAEVLKAGHLRSLGESPFDLPQVIVRRARPVGVGKYVYEDAIVTSPDEMDDLSPEWFQPGDRVQIGMELGQHLGISVMRDLGKAFYRGIEAVYYTTEI